jgi:hypothetical protein
MAKVRRAERPRAETALRRFLYSILAAAALSVSGCGGAPESGAIATRADVRVDDGREYVIETYYAGVADAVIRQTRPNGEINTSVLSGEDAASDEAESALEMERTVVLGHQFHAILLNFDEIAISARDGETTFAGETRRMREGYWPHGEGTARIVYASAGAEPEALVFNFAGVPEITVTLADWREDLPYRLTINDGSHTFDYTFTAIEQNAARPDWAPVVGSASTP